MRAGRERRGPHYLRGSTVRKKCGATRGEVSKFTTSIGATRGEVSNFNTSIGAARVEVPET